jgi:NAD(P)-dependent dehydrogenase (short-subunit alcohol dehydrogenase family)
LHDPRNIVIATARDSGKSAGLQALVAKYTKNRIVTLDLDVTIPETIQAAALEVQSLLPDGLDHLISNAGASLQSLASFEDLLVIQMNLASHLAASRN